MADYLAIARKTLSQIHERRQSGGSGSVGPGGSRDGAADDSEREAIQWVESAPADELDAVLAAANQYWVELTGTPASDEELMARSEPDVYETIPPRWPQRWTDEELDAHWAAMEPADVAYATAPRNVPKCSECGHLELVEVPVHGGQSIRADCAYCRRFVWFPVWYGKPQVCRRENMHELRCPWCWRLNGHTELCAELNRWEPVVPFGRYKGKPLSEIPRGYLRWLVSRPNITREVRDAAAALLGARTKSTIPTA